MKIKKDSRLILTQGEYDEYGILGNYIALVDFDTDTLVNLFLDAHPEQARDCYFETEKFEEWLVSHVVIKLIATTEWHIGSYDTVGAKLSERHQALRDADAKKRQDEDAAEYAAHPESFVSTGSSNGIQVRGVT